jgi:hypothetical protein
MSLFIRHCKNSKIWTVCHRIYPARGFSFIVAKCLSYDDAVAKLEHYRTLECVCYMGDVVGYS